MTIGTVGSPAAQAPPGAEVSRARTGGPRLARALAAGAAAGGVVLIGRQTGAFEGIAGLVVALLLLLAVPTSQILSRRILLTGVLVLGWLPLLWVVDLSVDGIGRVSLLLAGTAAGLVGWALAAGERSERRRRLRRLVPKTAVVDLLPLGSAAVAGVMLAPWLRLRSPSSALSVLMTGWDHSAHYGMTAMLREHGVMIWRLAAPAGSDGWAYTHYPQGFHATAAAIMELLGGAVGTVEQEVVLYGRAVGLLAAAGVVVVTAGVAALPELRRRPLAAAIPAGVVVAAFLWGPAGLVLADGFPNFFLACVLLAAAPLVVIPAPRWSSPVAVAAVAGIAVGIAHSWALLLTMAVPVLLVVFAPIRRRRVRASRRGWVAIGILVLVAAAWGIAALLVIRVQPLEDILVLGGGVTQRGVNELVVVVELCVVALTVLGVLGSRPIGDRVHRLLLTSGGVLGGALLAAWIARVQLRAGGLGYYFWKYAIALELLALVIGSVALAAVLVRGRRPVRTSFVAVVAGVTAVGVLLGFGAPHPRLEGHWGLRESAGIVARVRLALTSDSPAPEADRVLAAATASRAAGAPAVYLPIDMQGWLGPASVAQWHAGLSGWWTDDLNEPIGLLVGADIGAEAVPALARRVLDSRQGLSVVVPPEVADQVRASLPTSLRDRILSW